MILSELRLRNFRSHKNLDIKFSERLNYIAGGNGQGKTSILEAIYYLCTTKSNSSPDSEVVRFGEEEFEADGLFKDGTGNNARVYYSAPENKKYFFLNGKQVHRVSEVIGKFPVVLLTPFDHSITQGSPADRRKFVDSVISQQSDVYLKTLLDYNKILKQRSSLLNKLKEFRSRELLIEFDAWTERLISSGTALINYRKKFIDEFNEYINSSYKVIMESSELPGVNYNYLGGSCTENVEDYFREQIKTRREDELRRGSNLVGPHKDDFVFAINNINLRTFGSQGQHKTFQVVLRFAEFFYLKDKTGSTPLFLLDDVFGELDANRAARISSYLSNIGQAFITITDLADFSFLKKNESDLMMILKNGEITYA